MPTTYAPPTVVIRAQGAQSLVSAGARQPAVLVLGTAPQGPDVPIVLDPTNSTTIYGNPASSASLGYTMPLMMQLLRSQRPPTGEASPMQFVACRAGVTRASTTVAASNVNQIWTITFDASTTGGAFTLTYDSATTTSITYSATAATTVTNIQNALNALSSVGTGNATVATLSATQYTITAAGTLANQLLPNFTAANVSLTGTSASVASAITTPGSGSCFTVEGIGPYAGTAGNDLWLQIVTDIGGAVTEVTLWDSGGVAPLAGPAPAVGTWTVVQDFTTELGIYDLSTPQGIVNTINGANNTALPTSVLEASLASGPVLPPAGLYHLQGGADGLGTTASHASLAALLTASLAYQVDYIVAGFDANDIEGTISTHIQSEAFAQNQFRKAVLGPKQGITYSRLTTQSGASTGWYNAYQSSRVVIVGHDAVLLPNPITGTAGVYDGFYLAAAVAGLKVTSPIYETLIGFPIAGVVGVPLPPDNTITTPLTSSQKDALSAAGLLVVEPQGGAYVVRDSLTSTRYIINNTINPFSQWNVQDIDDAVSNVLLAAVLPFKGQAMPNLETANTLLQSACTGAMASLGQTINGVKNITVTTDPNTLIPTIDVVYITRFPFRTIEIRTSFTFL